MRHVDRKENNNDRKSLKTGMIIAGIAIIWIAGIVFALINFTLIGGKIVSKKVEAIDLSGKNVSISGLTRLRALKEIYLLDTGVSIEEYETLIAAFPESYIRWSVPLSSGSYDNESEEISISSITEEDIGRFAYFEKLKRINADGIPDWQLLSLLETRYPDIDVDWGVELSGKCYSSDLTELQLSDRVDLTELYEKLGAFKQLEKVSAKGDVFEIDEQLALVKQYPELNYEWLIMITPEGVPSTTEALDFSGNKDIDLDLLSKSASLFADLKSIDLSGCGFSNAELKKVSDAYPGADVLWQFSIYGQEVSSLDEEIDFSGKQIEDTSDIENALIYLKNIKKVIMSDCGISNEEMDALNKRYDDVKFVWTVTFGSGYRLRTDETAFIASLYYGSAQKARGDLTDSSIEPIKYCTDMVALDVGHQHFSNVEFCSEMKDLKWLIISQTRVNDLSPLANCPELYFLEMFLCPVEDLSPLLNCTKLRHLNICQCPTASSLSVLAQMTWLERCWMSGGFTYDDKTDRDYVYSDEFLPHTMKRLRGLDHTGDGWRNYPAYYEMRDVLGAYYLPTYWSSNDWRNNPNVIVPEGFIEEHGLEKEE